MNFITGKHIKVVYAPGSSTESVVEITLAMMVIGARSLYKGIENTKKNDNPVIKEVMENVSVIYIL